MSQNGGPITGLGEENFDLSLHVEQVDHGFFDEPSSSSELEMNRMSSASDREEHPIFSYTICHDYDRHGLGLGILEEKIQKSQTHDQISPESESTIISNETLTTTNITNSSNSNGTLNQKEPTICVSVENADSPLISAGETNLNTNENIDLINEAKNSDDIAIKKEVSRSRTNKKAIPGILFPDLSDSSSEEDVNGDNKLLKDLEKASLDEIDSDFNYFIEKYHDYLDIAESDFSDITEVSPLSSIAPSPLPPQPIISTKTTEENISDISSHLNQTNISENETQDDGDGYEDDFENYQGEDEDSDVDSNLLSEVASTSGSYFGFNNNNRTEDTTGNSRTNSSISSSNNLFKISNGHDTANSPTFSSTSNCSSYCKSVGPKNRSFSKDQVKLIERDNKILLKKIFSIHRSNLGGNDGSRSSKSFYKTLQCPASIARLKQQRKIDYENSLLVKKLVNVKPSNEIIKAFQK